MSNKLERTPFQRDTSTRKKKDLSRRREEEEEEDSNKIYRISIYILEAKKSELRNLIESLKSHCNIFIINQGILCAFLWQIPKGHVP
ncbi:hypothetical protein H5410_010864 [Solanum commersonii]|uniref:Uncharacterized protein n=1 Tax=Solanum commersonii TaxID=4109 RepID=A0A9J6ALZ9_SOLCO|nr:hypothetical protein H5410_010864 [Solanum commersonii]